MQYQTLRVSLPTTAFPMDWKCAVKKSQNQKCKRKRARSIRKGIDHYFERKNLKDSLGDEYSEDDFEDFEEDDDWYH